MCVVMAWASLACFQLQHQAHVVGPGVYVFRLDCNCNATALAAATEASELHLLDPSTLCVVNKLEGHQTGIEDVRFYHSNPSCLASCSRDGSARLWDFRAPKAAVARFDLKTEEAYSCSVGCQDSVLACGAGHTVRLFDLAKGKVRAIYNKYHSDTVNHVSFHPVDTTRLFSGGVDNLIVVLNTAEPREDDAWLGAISNEDCVQSFSLVNPDRNTLCSVSTTDEVRVWDVTPGQDDSDANSFGMRRAKFQGIREHDLLRREESFGYVVETFYDQPSGEIVLLVGTGGSGEEGQGVRELLLFRVSLEEASSKPMATFMAPTSPGAALAGAVRATGHTDVVRCATTLPSGTVFTAGEDGLICAWRFTPGSAGAAAAGEGSCSSLEEPNRFTLENQWYGAHRSSATGARASPY